MESSRKLESKNERIFLLSSVVCFFVIFMSYKLTNSPLWLDETIEYWYSKVMVGLIPGVSDLSSMYQRIISTFQPPLYNILMFFWLAVSSQEWWFRFAGVVVGAIGIVGLYKTVEKLCNYRVAAIVCISACFIYRFVYYTQECGEYNLIIALLWWTFYFYKTAYDNLKLKNILLFVSFCVLSMYSQYGAVIVIVPLLISLFIKAIFEKRTGSIKNIILVYIGAAVGFAVPLFVFFLIPQMKNQGSLGGTPLTITFEGNIFSDFWISINRVLKYCLFENPGITTQIVINLIMIFILCASIFLFIKVKENFNRAYIISHFATLILFYALVKLGYYANVTYMTETFASRYSVFYIPVFVIYYSYVVCRLIKLFENKQFKIDCIIYGSVISILVCFCFNGWESIKNNWYKDSIRIVTENWYTLHGYECDTVIYPGANAGFKYYVENDKQNSLLDESKIYYLPMRFNCSQDEYTGYLNAHYGESWPVSLYLCASNFGSDLDTLKNVFISRGYTVGSSYGDSSGQLLFVHLEPNS